jgi:hypothetical protein
MKERRKELFFGELKKIWTESIDYYALEKYSNETIIIDTRPISTLKFKLTQKEKDFLVECGKIYTLKYLVKNNFFSEADVKLNEKLKLLEIKRKHLIKKIKKKRLIKFLVVILIILFYCNSKLF